MTIVIQLSRKVFIQRREVYETLVMLADVGGLFDFVRLAISVTLGFFTPYYFLVSQVKALYHFSTQPVDA